MPAQAEAISGLADNLPDRVALLEEQVNVLQQPLGLVAQGQRIAAQTFNAVDGLIDDEAQRPANPELHRETLAVPRVSKRSCQ